MSILDVVCLVLAGAFAVYLFAALLKPELFH